MTTFLAQPGVSGPALPTTYSFVSKAGLRTQLPPRTLGWPLATSQNQRPLSTPGQPVISCATLSCAEFLRRTDAAEDEEEQLQQKYNNQALYGREIMWHGLFAAEYLAVVSRTPLPEIAAWQENIDSWANQGRTLDRTDYGYLADLLREELAEPATVGKARLRLERALWWVEAAAQKLASQEA